MTTPITSIYVRPGSTSYTWNFANASVQTAGGASAITSVSFFLDSSASQQMARGSFQYSVDGGHSWSNYNLPTDSEGTWMPANTVWRFVDTDTAEVLDAGNFTMHWKLADGSTASSSAAVMADDSPVGVVDSSGSMLSTLHNGDTVTVLHAIDNGDPLGGRWVIDSQSQAGLFGISTDAATGVTKLVVANAAAIPALDNTASVSLHYYDHYQVDANGNPIPNLGATGTISFDVVAGSSQALPAFGPDIAVASASGASAQPVLASLSNGSFAVAWQGADSSVWAQVRTASGDAAGAAIHLTSSSDANTEGQPAIAALTNGRFAVAYSVQDAAFNSHVAYRVVEANGSVGAEINASGASGAAKMPSVAGLADGSFEMAWSDGGKLVTEHVSASGVPGAATTYAADGSVSSPSVAALGNGSYVTVWGQGADGNVYAQVGGAGPVIQVTTDGAAANNLTAAPLAHVTALAGGGFVVAWDSYSNDTRGFSMSDIFFQRFDNAGNALGEIEQANVDSGGGRFDAGVAASADGGFIVEWQGPDADGSGVFGRRFGADGSAVDAHEFQVNAQSQGDQSGPAVAAFGNGGFASAWIDSSGSGGATIEARVLAGSGTSSSGSGASGGSGGAVSPPPGTSTGSGSTGSAGSGSTATGGSGSTGSTGTGATGSSGAGSTGSSGSGSTGSGGGVVSTPAPEKVVGSSGANVFVSGSGSHAIDGGAGVDIVSYPGSHTSFTVTAGASGITVTGGSGAVLDTLTNVERLQFSDVTLAFDVNGTAGQAYRLYQAAFDRAPDATGLGFWIKALDSGMTLDQVANGFASSHEFSNLYGSSTTDSQFVDALYQNVLHRSGDTAGEAFWVTAIEQHGEARESVLSNFSESGENQAQVIGSIQHGIAFVPWA